VELPGDAGFETLAGFLLFRFGYIPTPGESVMFENRTFIVEQMDRNRIARVKIVNSRPADPGPATAEAGSPNERAS
jgi:CBS domain containing-hemolysin-like protein